MMPGVDMNRVHLMLGLTHPVFGPLNLAAYSAVVGYAWYAACIQMLVDISYPVERSGSQK